MATTPKPKPNILQRLHAVMKECPQIAKDVTVSDRGRTYPGTTHDAVTDAIRPLFVKHGIVAVPFVKAASSQPVKSGSSLLTEIHGDVTFFNVDDPKDCVTASGYAVAIDHDDKGPGKALSYLVKGLMLKIVLARTGENDEERPAPKAEAKAPKTQRAVPQEPVMAPEPQATLEVAPPAAEAATPEATTVPATVPAAAPANGTESSKSRCARLICQWAGVEPKAPHTKNAVLAADAKLLGELKENGQTWPRKGNAYWDILLDTSREAMEKGITWEQLMKMPSVKTEEPATEPQPAPIVQPTEEELIL